MTWLSENTAKQGAFKAIDQIATLGLAGVHNSLAYRVHEIEKHLHSPSRCFGKSADQSGNDWALTISGAGMPTVYRAISGNATYGADDNDEAKLIGTDDSGQTGMVKFDLHLIFVSAASATTVYGLRIVWGTGTMADAITAEQYSEILMRRNPGGGENHIVPVLLQMPRLTWGTHKVWLQVKNATDNATFDFYIGLHEYQG